MTPRQSRYTPAQRALLADRKCVDCGQPTEQMRQSNRQIEEGRPPVWYDLCAACRKEMSRSRGGQPIGRYQGAGASSTAREYHRRLGYGSGEGR